MHLFLTSQIGATVKIKGVRSVGKINDDYGFLTQFKKCVQRRSRMLYISYTPSSNGKVSDWFEHTVVCLKDEGMGFAESILINGSNADRLRKLVPDTDVIFLSGGHLPTQNLFFQQINLRDILSAFDGIIVAQSAGSMNCAETVYVCPELPGESSDPHFERFRPGLGLTHINIIPHYNANANLFLDGKKLYQEIIYPDTFKTPLYVLSDGAYFHICNGKAMHYGEVYRFECGKFEQLESFGDSCFQA